MTHEEEALDPIRLYERWERQHWSVLDYDLEGDVPGWEALRPFTRRELRAGIMQYFSGEAAVANRLAPLAQAAPTAEEGWYLATQLADEARHTIFFHRYLQTVEGNERPFEEYGQESWVGVPEGHLELFERRLNDATDRVRSRPGDHDAWYEAVALYHLVLEAVLAINGQRVILEVVRELGTLPALERAMRDIARDESRHIGFGVGALRRGVQGGRGELVEAVVRAAVPPIADILVTPGRRYPALIPPAVLEGRARQLEEFAAAARRALVRRLGTIGLGAIVPELERDWDAALERALDEYERRHGVAHPVRSLRTTRA